MVVESSDTSPASHTLTVMCDERVRWRRAGAQGSAKQLFVSDDGRVAVIGADDGLTFYAQDGAIVGRTSLLDLVRPAAVSLSTAGRAWDDYLAGSFAEDRFILDGRGAPPLVFDACRGAAVEVPMAHVREIQRLRARGVLEQALAQLSANEVDARDPWRLAAVGWARVAARTEDVASVEVLERLGALPLTPHGYTLLSLLGIRCPADPVYVDRYALDPLRQATNCALLRLGRSAASVTTMVCRRRGLLATSDWLELERPPDWLAALADLRAGASPSDAVAHLGTPMHVQRSEDAIQWSYHHRAEAGPATSDLVWGRRGLTSCTARPLPPASPQGLVA